MPETECERRHPVLFTSGALEELWIQDSEPRLHQVFGFLFYASCLTLFYYSVSKKKFSTWNVYYDLTDGIINELNVASVLTGRDWFLWWILILFVRVFSIWLNVHVFKKIMGVFVAPWDKIELKKMFCSNSYCNNPLLKKVSHNIVVPQTSRLIRFK